MEVVEVPGEMEEEENLGADRRKEDDLSEKPLTEKMVYLMQKISEYGYLTRPEVEMIYANQTYSYRVLGALRSKGLIGDFETGKLPKKAVYLKPKGYRTLEKFGKLRLKRRFLPQHFKPFIFEHRLACARVGLVLDGNPLVKEFLPESLLWERVVQKRQKLCDGEFVYEAPDAQAERVGLEVELSLKNRDKLDESLRALSDREDLAQVWWICGNATILKALKSEVMQRYWNAAPRHLFCLMDDFIKRQHQVPLMDAQGSSFKIDPAGPTLRPLPKPVPEVRAEVPPQPKPERSYADLRRDLEDAQHNVRWMGIELERLRNPPKPPPAPLLLWVLPALGGCAAAALLAWYFFLQEPAAPPPPPERPWIARKILNAQDIEALRGTWVVKNIALRSRGDNYRASIKLLNPDGFWCGLMGFKVMDANRQVLGDFHIKGGDWIFAHHYWDGNLAFKAPGKATQILLGIESDGWDCGDMEIPLVYN